MNKFKIAIAALAIALGYTYYLLDTTRTELAELSKCQEQYVAVSYTNKLMTEKLAEALPHFNKAVEEASIFGWDAEVVADMDTFAKHWNEADELSRQAVEQAKDPKCFEQDYDALTT